MHSTAMTLNIIYMFDRKLMKSEVNFSNIITKYKSLDLLSYISFDHFGILH